MYIFKVQVQSLQKNNDNVVLDSLWYSRLGIIFYQIWYNQWYDVFVYSLFCYDIFYLVSQNCIIVIEIVGCWGKDLDVVGLIQVFIFLGIVCWEVDKVVMY